MKRKRPKPNPHIPWTDFLACTHMANADGIEYEIPPGITIWKNNIYTVNAEECEPIEPYGTVTWLSIKRNDRAPLVSHWRELQLIKNAICAPEREAVEIYPAESRCVDTSNQYHLWVFPPGFRFPFGYRDRMLIDETVNRATDGRNAKQRPWPLHQRPPDALTGIEYDRQAATDPKHLIQPVIHRRKLS